MCQIGNTLKNTGSEKLVCYKVLKVYRNPVNNNIEYMSPIHPYRWVRGRTHRTPAETISWSTIRVKTFDVIEGGFFHMFMKKEDAEKYKRTLKECNVGGFSQKFSVVEIKIPEYTDYYEGTIEISDVGEYPSVASRVVIF